MTAESTPLPITAGPNAQDAPKKPEIPSAVEALPDTPADARKRHILLLENRADQANPWRRVFMRSGYECEVVGTKERARELLGEATRAFDLMIADLGLTRSDDLAFAREIRGMPGGDVLPIIILSGLNSDEARKQARALGVVAYVVKPVDAATLLPLVARWIRSTQA